MRVNRTIRAGENGRFTANDTWRGGKWAFDGAVVGSAAIGTTIHGVTFESASISALNSSDATSEI